MGVRTIAIDDGQDRVLGDIRALTGLGCVVFDDQGPASGWTDGVQAIAMADLLAPAAHRAVAAGSAVVCRWPALGLVCGAAPFGNSGSERAAVTVGPARERGVRARAVTRVAREHGTTPEALRERLRALPNAGEPALLAAAQLAASALSGLAVADVDAADPLESPLARSLGLLQERILEVGRDGRILRCTPGGYDSGNDVEDLLGRHVTEFIEAGMRNQAERDLVRAWETGSALSVVRGIGRGGTPKHLAIAIARRDRPAGPATSVIGVVRDMTALHEARRASDRRTAQARLMADVAHALADPESLEWLLEEVSRVLREGMRFLASSAHVNRPGGWELVTSHAMSVAFIEEICPAATLRPHDHPLLQARQVTVSHPGQWEVSEEARQREGLGTVVALPIADHDEILGLLTLASRGRREVAEDERAFLALVAGALGAAVRRCLARPAAGVDQGLAGQIVEACGDALVVVERNGGRIVWWNRALEVLLGVPEDELVHRRADEFLRDNDLDLLRRAIAESESAERWPVRLRVRGRRSTGEPRAIEATISPLPAAEGAERLVATLRDATDDESLRDQEHLLANAVTVAAELVVIINTEGRITYTNPSAARLLGFSEAELMGRSFEQMVAEANSPEAVEQMREDICLGHWRGDFALRTRAGTTVWVRGSSGIMCDEDGSALSVIIVGSDVTRERQLQTQILASEKLAAVGQLASGIAHELNNIIGAMSGYAQLAKASGTQQALEKLADTVIESSARAAEIAENLLGFARPREPRRERARIDRPIDAALQLAASDFEKWDIQVSRSYAPSQPQLLIDVGMFQQVFLNLFINAVHAMPGGGRLSITVRHEKGQPGERGHVVVLVSDTGCGISHEDLPRIFEPFFTTKQLEGDEGIRGTGLGLHVSRSIIEAHGGTITAESRLGEGTTMVIRVPVVAGVAPHATEAIREVRPRRASVAAGLRVLVAEDDRTFRSLLADALAFAECDVVHVGDGARAIELITAGGLDLVVSDLRLPRADGRMVLEAAQHTVPPTPVIIITGQSGTQVDRELLERGAYACLHKPIELPALLDLVEAVARTHGLPPPS